MEKVQKRRINRSRRRLNRASRRFYIRRIMLALRKKRSKDRVFKIPQPMMQIKSKDIVLHPYTDTKDVVIKNISDKSVLDWYIIPQDLQGAPWLSVNTFSGSMAAGGSTTITFTADESGLSNGTEDYSFPLRSNGGTITLTIYTEVGLPTGGPGTLTVVGDPNYYNIVALLWSNASLNTDSIKIYRDTSNIWYSGNELDEINNAQTSYIDNTAAQNTTYYYWVHFINQDGISESNNEPVAVTTIDPPNANPTNLTFPSIKADTFKAAWTNTCTNETGVKVYVSTSNTKPGTSLPTLPANSTTHNNIAFDSSGAPIVQNTTYYIWVEFINNDGASDDVTGSITTTDPPNADPTNMSFTGITPTEMTVNWTNSCTNETEVRFRYDTINVTPVVYTTLAANATSHTVSSLTQNTTYYFWVQFYNADGFSGTLAGSATTIAGTTWWSSGLRLGFNLSSNPLHQWLVNIIGDWRGYPGVNVGDTIKVDSEEMTVTVVIDSYKRIRATRGANGTTIVSHSSGAYIYVDHDVQWFQGVGGALVLAIAVNSSSINLIISHNVITGSTPNIHIGNHIKINNEIMKVTAIHPSGLRLKVSRNAQGTTATSHSIGDDVYVSHD